MSKNKRLNPIQKALANPKSLRAAINGKCFECGGDQYKERPQTLARTEQGGSSVFE